MLRTLPSSFFFKFFSTAVTKSILKGLRLIWVQYSISEKSKQQELEAVGHIVRSRVNVCVLVINWFYFKEMKMRKNV